jgi:hypothetical protein
MNNQVTLIFPTKKIKEAWMAWMCDGGGEWSFLELAEEIIPKGEPLIKRIQYNKNTVTFEASEKINE